MRLRPINERRLRILFRDDEGLKHTALTSNSAIKFVKEKKGKIIYVEPYVYGEISTLNLNKEAA